MTRLQHPHPPEWDVEPGGRAEPMRWTARGRLLAAVLVVVFIALVANLTGCGRQSVGALRVAGVAPQPVELALQPVPKVQALRDLAALRVQSRRHVAGYSRAQFGKAWTDHTTALDGGNHCATNVDVLARQLVDQQSERVGHCPHLVRSGTLPDPYTGRDISYVRGQRPVRVDIDHVYPLALAWDQGASRWTAGERARFANDVAVNLLAVDASSNRAKGDSSPAEWSPANPAGACLYAGRFVEVAKTYGLPVTPADKAALRTTINRACK